MDTTNFEEIDWFSKKSHDTPRILYNYCEFKNVNTDIRKYGIRVIKYIDETGAEYKNGLWSEISESTFYDAKEY